MNTGLHRISVVEEKALQAYQELLANYHKLFEEHRRALEHNTLMKSVIEDAQKLLPTIHTSCDDFLHCVHSWESYWKTSLSSNSCTLGTKPTVMEEESVASQTKVQELMQKLTAERMNVMRLTEQIMDLRGSIRVYVRLRPLPTSSLLPTVSGISVSYDQRCLTIETLDTKADDKRLNFTHIFQPSALNADVFHPSVEEFVNSALSGNPTVVLAYGPSGSGKTHTMHAKADSIIQKTIEALFTWQKNRNMEDSVEYTIEARFVEIWNDKVSDLFSNHAENGKFKVSFDDKIPSKDTITKLAPTQLNDLKHFDSLFQAALGRRKTAETKANSTSSRSHSILSLWVSDRRGSSSSEVTASKPIMLDLVDLAGTEEMSPDDKDKSRETAHINQTLLQLRDVLVSLKKEKVLPPGIKRTQLASARRLKFRESNVRDLSANRTDA